jgi:methyl-accepting chemotaxis protein
MAQTMLVFLRILVCSIAVLVVIRSEFTELLGLLTSLNFGAYAAFFTGVCIYYFLYTPASRIAEESTEEIGRRGLIGKVDSRASLYAKYSTVSTIAPTIITTVGILCLVILLGKHSDKSAVFLFRITVALILNIVTNVVILILGQRFREKRLSSIASAAKGMLERGDTSQSIPSDLADNYAWTAFYINQNFEQFRQILRKMESASSRLSGTVMNFSSQIRETVAATTQQASSVKEAVGTMEDATNTNHQIQGTANDLLDNAQGSQSLVDNGFGNIQDTIKKMDEIKDANVQTQAEIVDLSEQIASIGEVIDIINNIANQTRIIAFNAELEASAAGDAGISFRIVAEEIRRLAGNTVEALVNIKNRISEIQKSSRDLQLSSEEGTQKIEDGMKLSAELNDIFMRIRSSAEQTASAAEGITKAISQQTSANDMVFTTLKQISEGAEQVLSATRNSNAEVERTQALIDELKQVVNKFNQASASKGEPAVVLNFSKAAAN